MIAHAQMIYTSLRRKPAISGEGPFVGYGGAPDPEYGQLTGAAEISFDEMKIISGTFLMGNYTGCRN
jgi:hypothetical protein